MYKYKICIVIPVFNTEKYLSRCLESVLSQTFPRADFQVIVVDDASPGDSETIVKSFHDNNIDLNLSYIRHKTNSSLFQARRTGVFAADSMYILSLDSDDAIESTTLATLYETADSEKLDILHYRMRHIQEDRIEKDIFPNIGNEYSSSDLLSEFLGKNIHWPMCGKLIRTKFYRDALDDLQKIGDPYVNSMEDFLQFFPLIFHVKKYKSIDFFGYLYYSNPASLSKNMAKGDKEWSSLCENVATVRKYVLKIAEMHRLNSKNIFDLEDLFTNTAFAVTRYEASKFPEEKWYGAVAKWYRVFNPAVVTIPFLREYGDKAYRMLHDHCVFHKRKPVKRVAVVIQRLYYGGTERVISRMLSLWSRYHLPVEPYLISLEEPDSRDFDCPKIPRFVISGDAKYHQWELQQILKDNSIDTVLFANILGAYSIEDAITCHLFDCNTIGMEHGGFVYNMVFASDLTVSKKYYAAFFDVITCLSSINCALWRSYGIPQYVFHRNPLTYDSVYELEDVEYETYNILFVGRLTSEKCPQKIIEMFAILHRMNSKARLVIVGGCENAESRELAALQELCNRLSVTDFVTFAGEHKDASKYYKEATIHVMASKFEGSPMVLFEAKHFCIPTVMLSLPYLDCASEADGCIQVPQSDLHAMASAIQGLLSDPSRLNEMRKKAKDSLKRFSNEDFISWWERFLQNYVNGDLPGSKVEPVSAMDLTNILNANVFCIREYHDFITDIVRHENDNKNQALSRELSNAQSRGESLSKELQRVQGHAEYLSKELQRVQGHAEYLSHELQPYESSRILRTTLRILNLLRRIKRKILN